MGQRLERSTTNRVIAGVCGGLGEYLQVDPTWVRIFFVVLALFTGGLWILVYVALVLLVPLPGRAPLIGPQVTTGGERPGQRTEETSAPPPPPTVTLEPERARTIGAWVLIALGAIFLLGNVTDLWFWNWRYLWPLSLVGLGILLLAWQTRR